MLNSWCNVDEYVEESTFFLANAHLASSERLQIKPERHKATFQLHLSCLVWWTQELLLQDASVFFNVRITDAFIAGGSCVSRTRDLRSKDRNGSSCKVGLCVCVRKQETACW